MLHRDLASLANTVEVADTIEDFALIHVQPLSGDANRCPARSD